MSTLLDSLLDPARLAEARRHAAHRSRAAHAVLIPTETTPAPSGAGFAPIAGIASRWYCWPQVAMRAAAEQPTPRTRRAHPSRFGDLA